MPLPSWLPVLWPFISCDVEWQLHNQRVASDGFVLCDIYFGRQKRGPLFLKATLKIITAGSSKECLHGKSSCCPPGDVTAGQSACLTRIKPWVPPSTLRKPNIVVHTRYPSTGGGGRGRGENQAFQVILGYTGC